MELLPGGLSATLAEGLVRLGAWMPFEQAAEHLAFFWRVRLSEATARRHAEAAGAAYVTVQTAEVERLEREASAPPPGPAVQQVSADGAMVPLVGGVWGEVKTVAIGTVAPARGPDGAARGPARATELSYFSRLADRESFTRLAHVELHRRGTETAGVVVGVMDGAEWEQKFLDRYRPDAVRVLDFPHALEHLSAAAQATFGAATAEGAVWLAAQADALQHGAPSAVLVALNQLPVSRASEPFAARQARDGTFGYLAKRLEQLRYAEFLAAGYPIASGAVESANKLVVERRLKGSGMHWAPGTSIPCWRCGTSPAPSAGPKPGPGSAASSAPRRRTAGPRVLSSAGASGGRRPAHPRSSSRRRCPGPVGRRLDPPGRSSSSTVAPPGLIPGSAASWPRGAPQSRPNAKL